MNLAHVSSVEAHSVLRGRICKGGGKRHDRGIAAGDWEGEAAGPARPSLPSHAASSPVGTAPPFALLTIRKDATAFFSGSGKA